MVIATVGEIQKNFSDVLRRLGAGDEIIVTRHGKPVAKISSMEASKNIDWPDFFEESLDIQGDSMERIVMADREDRF